MVMRLENGHRDWGVTRDKDGHRNYKIKFLTQGNSRDGPASALVCAGLPEVGAIWQFDDDYDLWASCRYEATARPVVTNQGNNFWEVEMLFSTRPEDRCQNTSVEDPLLEPQKVSGSFVKYSEEATHDRFGNPVTNSCHEQIRGPQAEFDRGRPTVKIEQNVADLELPLCASLYDCVNDAVLWGLNPRCVKLSSFSWSRNFFHSCSVYFTRTFEFDVNYDTFDRQVLDEGTKVLNGHWGLPSRGENPTTWVLDNINGAPPDPGNPRHFIRAEDRRGNPLKVLLDGRGRPAGVSVANTGPFICLVNGTTGGTLSNTTNWALQVGSPGAWNSGTTYDVGNVVTSGGSTYIALASSLNVTPAGSDLWYLLPGGITSKGTWNSGTVYNVGDSVTDPGGITSTAYVSIEKYFEANLLLLNLPTDLNLSS